MQRRAAWPISVAVAGWLFAGGASCVIVPPSLTAQCEADDQCDPGWQCADGRCARTCGRTSECGPRETCMSAGYCLLVGAAGCADAADCIDPGACEEATGAECVRGVCSYPPTVCDAPPLNACVNTDQTHRVFSDIGTCDRQTDQCQYPFQDQPCPNCSATCFGVCSAFDCDDTAGGCHTAGFCTVDLMGPPTAGCEYVDAADGAACVRDPFTGAQGVCVDGACESCITHVDCDDGNDCTLDSCVGNACQYTNLNNACDDGDACTYDDRCSLGVCVGTAMSCVDDPDPCGTRRTCNGTNTCDVSFPGPGDSCDDGDLCTHDDRCSGGGACAGTPITCSDDAGVCGANRACDGTSSCAVTFPGSSIGCDDGADCTHSDVCNGAGGCDGTTYQCNDDSGTCGANRTCDGLGGCNTSYPTSATSCSDGNPCTHTDRCNGSGGCSGTSYSCMDDAGTCAANRSCDGMGGCNTTFPGSGTTCNDGIACTHTDRCNGMGGCSGTTYSCSDDAATCGANRSCNGMGGCNTTYPGGGTGCNDGNPCTTGTVCNGSGGCTGGSSRADGYQCGGQLEDRCCGGTCVDISTDRNHCGGCGQACTGSFQCEPVENTGCSSSVVDTSGRCLCNGANAHCPDNQICRLPMYNYPNRCGPPGTANCAPGQTAVNLSGCPDYCTY